MVKPTVSAEQTQAYQLVPFSHFPRWQEGTLPHQIPSPQHMGRDPLLT